jgi:hypothetical protein
MISYSLLLAFTFQSEECHGAETLVVFCSYKILPELAYSIILLHAILANFNFLQADMLS